MGIYEELKERGLIAQITDEEEINPYLSDRITNSRSVKNFLRWATNFSRWMLFSACEKTLSSFSAKRSISVSSLPSLSTPTGSAYKQRRRKVLYRIRSYGRQSARGTFYGVVPYEKVADGGQ